MQSKDTADTEEAHSSKKLKATDLPFKHTIAVTQDYSYQMENPTVAARMCSMIFQSQYLDVSIQDPILSTLIPALPNVIMHGNKFNLADKKYFKIELLTIRMTQKDGTTQEFVMQYFNNTFFFKTQIPGAQYEAAATPITNFHVDMFEPLQNAHRHVRFATAVWNKPSAELGTLYQPLDDTKTYTVMSKHNLPGTALTEKGTGATEKDYEFHDIPNVQESTCGEVIFAEATPHAVIPDLLQKMQAADVNERFLIMFSVTPTTKMPPMFSVTNEDKTITARHLRF